MCVGSPHGATVTQFLLHPQSQRRPYIYTYTYRHAYMHAYVCTYMHAYIYIYWISYWLKCVSRCYLCWMTLYKPHQGQEVHSSSALQSHWLCVKAMPQAARLLASATWLRNKEVLHFVKFASQTFESWSRSRRDVWVKGGNDARFLSVSLVFLSEGPRFCVFS